MLLGDYLTIHYTPARPGLSLDYIRLLRATVQKLDSWAGECVSLTVDRETVGLWLASLLDSGLRPATVNSRARMLRSLLLAAYDDGLLDRPPRRFRRVPEYQPVPEAWTVEQVHALMCHTPLHFWRSVILATYWTGCRIGALLRARVADLDRGLTITRQKNGRQTWYPLPDSALMEIRRQVAGRPPESLIWPVADKRAFFRKFRRLVEAAGLPAPKGQRSLFHRLRRTTLSYCAGVDPGLAQRQADHSDYRTTRDHYIDPRIARQRSAVDVLADPL